MQDEAQSSSVALVGTDDELISFRDQVQEQLEQVLASRYFSRSHRLSSFLRYVVDQVLAGQEGQVKERTIGIEVFGRPVDYDTASDSIVRVTASEIRKRIAQYYQDPEHEGEFRITFAAGSYVPQFQPSSPAREAKEEIPTSTLSIEASSAGQIPARRHFWRGFVASSLLAILIASGATWAWQATHRTPFNFFWGPILKSSGPVLFCIADQKQYSSIELYDANNLSRQVTLPDKNGLTAIVIDDLGPTIHIAGLLQARGKQYALRGGSATTLSDLRTGPGIFIGAFDNIWTLRLTQNLRYRFTNNEQMTEAGIVDSRNPKRIWMVSNQQQMATDNYTDYAIVARFTDNITGKPAVIVAGTASGGSTAAAQFISDPSDLAQLMGVAKAAGGKPNMEIVLKTRIIGGEPGAPSIIASYFW